jgi:hypothetical protein
LIAAVLAPVMSLSAFVTSSWSFETLPGFLRFASSILIPSSVLSRVAADSSST